VYVATQAVKLLIKRDLKVNGANVLILGLTFKENCPDIRNTKIIEIYNELCTYGISTDVYDPWANPIEVKKEFNIDLIAELDKKYDEVIVAVAHNQFKVLNIRELLKENGCVYDLKSLFDKKEVDLSL
jgi:UDP-N-acetyl-D-glucosamine/UDP-N-acetyl-D-galactosamine dehydrogenase